MCLSQGASLAWQQMWLWLPCSMHRAPTLCAAAAVTQVAIHQTPCCCCHILQMGLGKTAQSIAVMAWLKQYAGVTAPFMVVAPLTTLGHWQREIQTWTGMVRRASSKSSSTAL